MSKSKRIILIRHGQSEGNADHSKYEVVPDYRLNLTQDGKRQAQVAGGRISDVIGNEKVASYVSPYYRTRQTYENLLIGGLRGNIAVSCEDPRLREQDYGHLRSIEEARGIDKERDDYGKFYYRISDGESGADVYDRLSTFIETLYRDFEKESCPDNVLIVTHGLTLRLFLMRWFHWSIEEFEELKNPKNCEFFVLKLDKSIDKYKLEE